MYRFFFRATIRYPLLLIDGKNGNPVLKHKMRPRLETQMSFTRFHSSDIALAEEKHDSCEALPAHAVISIATIRKTCRTNNQYV